MTGGSHNEEENQDLFGLTEEERQRHRLARKGVSGKPSFAKNRRLGPGKNGISKKKLAILTAPIVVGLLVVCLPVNAARCLTAAGQMLCDCKSYDAAIRACNLALGFNPASSEAYCVRAAANDDCQHYDLATADYSRAILMDPQLTSAYFQRGMTRYKAHDYKGAVADFGQTIKDEPGNAVAYVRRGIAHARLGEYDQAIADYDQATKLDPTNTEALYNRGWAMDLQYDETMEKGSAPENIAANGAQHTKLSAQVTDLSKKLEGAKTDPQLYYDRGLACLKLRKLKEAIADFDAAISLNPKFASAYVNRGLAYSSMKQYDKAIADYSAGVAVAPQSASAYYRRGLAYDRTANYSMAMADYKAARRWNPSAAAQYAALEAADHRRLHPGSIGAQLATNESALGKTTPTATKAEASPGAATASLAPTGKTSSAIANNLNSAIDTTSAAEHFQTGVKLAQQNKHGQSGTLQPPASGRMLPGGNVANQKSLSDEVRSHWQKAQDFDRNDQAEQALQEYKVVLAANPDSRTVRAIHHAMGNIYMKAKDYDNALTNFNLAINMGARERNLFRNRGMVYRALNQWQKALDDFNAAIEIDPSFAVAYHDRSKAYTALGRPDLAAAEAQKASELGYQPGSGRNR